MIDYSNMLNMGWLQNVHKIVYHIGSVAQLFKPALTKRFTQDDQLIFHFRCQAQPVIEPSESLRSLSILDVTLPAVVIAPSQSSGKTQTVVHLEPQTV